MAAKNEPPKDYASRVAERLIEQLQTGTAPWQKPWRAGELQRPHNPISGAKYRGVNNLHLMMQGYGDPRWMTYNQAEQNGWQVRKGEKGTLLQFLKREERQPELDAAGKPVIGADGKPKSVVVELERPKIMRFIVFNAEQIDGVPALKAPEPAAWNRAAEVEQVLASAGVPIREVPGDRAYYSPREDAITLPERSQFSEAAGFYATALHELGHATGHPSRLSRDLSGPFGSESYAREELRAEIASLMLGEDFGVGHDPGQHAAYVKSWVKILQDEPTEIVKACNDAEAIRTWVGDLKQEQTLTDVVALETYQEHAANAEDLARSWLADMEESPRRDRVEALVEVAKDQRKLLDAEIDARDGGQPALAPAGQIANTNRYIAEQMAALSDPRPVLQQPLEADMSNSDRRVRLAVPYSEKNEAKKLGATWNKDAKAWFAPDGADLVAFKRWLPDQKTVVSAAPSEEPQLEFARALKDAGLILNEKAMDSRGLPIMDGEFRRVPVDGDKPGQLGGGYVGHLDGKVPAGYILNYRADIKTNWKSQQATDALSPEDQKRLLQESKERQIQRDTKRDETHVATAKKLASEITNPALYKPADPNHPYLKAKGLDGDAGQLLQDNKGNLVVTGHDIDGRLWTVQRIGRKGWKGFEGGSKKSEAFHVNRQTDKGPIVIGEGWSTSEQWKRDTVDTTVITAFTAENLPAVAKAMRERFPDRPILIAADNDIPLELSGKTNVGLKYAKAAAEAVNGHYAAPPRGQLKDGSEVTDWNDHAQIADKEAVKQLMAEALVIADRRRISDAQQLGQGAEQVARTVEQNQSKVAKLGQAAAGQKAAYDSVRSRAKEEVDRQDSSDQRVDPNESEAVKRRIGRGRGRSATV